MVDSVSLIRSGYEYGTVPDRRGTIHTESGRERGKFRIPTLLVFITIWLNFFIENFPKLRACNPNFGQTY